LIYASHHPNKNADHRYYRYCDAQATPCYGNEAKNKFIKFYESITVLIVNNKSTQAIREYLY